MPSGPTKRLVLRVEGGGVVPVSRFDTVKEVPEVPNANLSRSNPFSLAPISKVCVRFPALTVKPDWLVNCERLIHFHTPLPSEPPPVTTSVLLLKPTAASPFTKIQAELSVGDLLPRLAAVNMLSSLNV